MIYKKWSGGGIIRNQCSLDFKEELHKPITGKFEKGKVISSFKDNIWGADLADMQLICKFNKGACFLLRVIDIHNQ